MFPRRRESDPLEMTQPRNSVVARLKKPNSRMLVLMR